MTTENKLLLAPHAIRLCGRPQASVIPNEVPTENEHDHVTHPGSSSSAQALTPRVLDSVIGVLHSHQRQGEHYCISGLTGMHFDALGEIAIHRGTSPRAKVGNLAV